MSKVRGSYSYVNEEHLQQQIHTLQQAWFELKAAFEAVRLERDAALHREAALLGRLHALERIAISQQAKIDELAAQGQAPGEATVEHDRTCPWGSGVHAAVRAEDGQAHAANPRDVWSELIEKNAQRR